MDLQPEVAVIILNWNGWSDTLKCLESLCQSTYTNYFVIVIDNGSRDGSAEKIQGWAAGNIKVESTLLAYTQKNKPITVNVLEGNDAEKEKIFSDAKVTLIRNEKNYGFAQGNNRGIKYALKNKEVQYCLLLNNDTIIRPDCLKALVHAAEADEQIGACQPKMLSRDNPSSIDALGITMFPVAAGAALIGHGELDNGQFGHNQEVFGACAGAALYRRTTLERIGLFDEAFFAYYEDVDLALRARLAGWKAMCVPEAVVYHGHSSTLGKDSPFKTYLLERNRYYYVIKNLPVDSVIKFLKSRPYAVIRTFVALIWHGRFNHAGAFFKGNLAGVIRIPHLFLKRRKIQSAKLLSDCEFKKWLEQ